MTAIVIDRPEPGVAVVTLSRPAALNALDDGLVAELGDALRMMDADDAVRVVVLTGAGRAFCAGLDLKAVTGGDAPPDSAMAWMDLQLRYAGLIPLIRGMGKPVIAAVKGVAAGAGMGLALACDVRIVGHSANFLIGAVRIGLSAGECGISYHLPRLVGAGRAFELMLTGRPVGGQEAAAIGLASRCVPDEELLNDALATARMIAANSPYAVRHTKQVMWTNLDAPGLDSALALENHVQTVGLMTSDFAEAVRAFAEKRAPVFTGT